MNAPRKLGERTFHIADMNFEPRTNEQFRTYVRRAFTKHGITGQQMWLMQGMGYATLLEADTNRIIAEVAAEMDQHKEEIEVDGDRYWE